MNRNPLDCFFAYSRDKLPQAERSFARMFHRERPGELDFERHACRSKFPELTPVRGFLSGARIFYVPKKGGTASLRSSLIFFRDGLFSF